MLEPRKAMRREHHYIVKGALAPSQRSEPLDLFQALRKASVLLEVTLLRIDCSYCASNLETSFEFRSKESHEFQSCREKMLQKPT